jgi:hypothetical protein
MPTSEGYDACLGFIPGVESACCGHGVEEPYQMTKLEQAITAVQEDIDIHRRWADFAKSHPDDPSLEFAGNLEHHEAWIRRYQTVLEVLKEMVK